MRTIASVLAVVMACSAAPAQVPQLRTPQLSLDMSGGAGEAVFSADGKRVAVCVDQAVKVWDAASGKEQASFKEGTWPLRSLAFRADSSLLVAGGPLASERGKARVWDVLAKKELATALASQMVYSVALSPDGKLLAVADIAAINIFDAESGKSQSVLKQSAAKAAVQLMAFSADNKRLAAGISPGLLGEQTIKVWDLAEGKELYTVKGHQEQLRGLAFSADGKVLASCSGIEGSMNKKLLVSGMVKLWEAETGKERATLKGYVREVRGLAFSADSKYLATAGGGTDIRMKKLPGEVRVWDVAAQKEVLTILSGTDDKLTCVAFSPDGKRLVSAGDESKVRLWDLSKVTR